MYVSAWAYYLYLYPKVLQSHVSDGHKYFKSIYTAVVNYCPQCDIALGAILLIIDLAPSVEDEDEKVVINYIKYFFKKVVTDYFPTTINYFWTTYFVTAVIFKWSTTSIKDLISPLSYHSTV